MIVAAGNQVEDGAIVGTALKEGGETTAPVDEERVKELVAAADEALERVRLVGTPDQLIGAHCAISAARLVTGDVSGALAAADEAVAGHKYFKSLGPEPLDDAFTGEVLAARLAGRRTPIKAALLDQKTLVGVGNIYACEALFLAGISPRRSAHTVQGERATKLVNAIRHVLARSIDDGGSTLRDYRTAQGERGLFQPAYLDTLFAEPTAHITPLRGSELWQVAVLEMWLQAQGV